MNQKKSRIILSTASLGVLILRHLFPSVMLDTIDVILVVLILLPWISDLVKGMELPGGFKVEFQELQIAASKILSSDTRAGLRAVSDQPEVITEKIPNPNLALVELRIQIGKRLNELASTFKLTANDDLPLLLHNLQKNHVLNESEMDGLRAIIIAGNQAAHGVSVDPRVAQWAQDTGPEILKKLDSKIKSKGKR